MIIKFDKKLYKLKAIKAAVREYKELADFDLELQERYIRLSVQAVHKENEQKIKDEFCNYVLFLTKS